ncbi:MAG: hypothetical protein KatS3mg105_2679 [Gemmatales bacterium]|nr:MAG: hypothetical protein KatS3mg105_2679 [Gemmatales bacterium]
MLDHFAGWVRMERSHRGRGRLARWIGRNWARVDYGFRIEPTWLELVQLDIPIANLPEPFAGYRMVQLTDLHCGRHLPSAYLQEVVETAQKQDADVIVLTGDFIHRGYKHIGEAARAVGKLKAADGVYAVLGNHDYSVRNALGIRRYSDLHRAVTEALQEQGIRVLHNEHLSLKRGDACINLVGIADLWSRECDPKRAFCGVNGEWPNIVLAHNPCTVELLDGWRCDLVLSGHTHGGQLHVPGVGRPALGKKARRFAAGLYRCKQGSLLYVNRGIGYGFRFRFGVRPEVAVFSLQPADRVEVRQTNR